jgi:hypothetical protein
VVINLFQGIITLVFGAAIGYFFNILFHRFKSITDSQNRNQEYVHKVKVEYLEKKLTSFLNPIINAIEFDSETWQRISALSSSNNVYPDNISEHMEKEFILANHVRALDLARENMHFLELDSELHKELIKYMRHIAAFQSIRTLREPLNPIDIDEPFPSQLKRLMREEYNKTKKQYDILMSNPNKALQRTSR